MVNFTTTSWEEKSNLVSSTLFQAGKSTSHGSVCSFAGNVSSLTEEAEL
jgi:hypothetical protein